MLFSFDNNLNYTNIQPVNGLLFHSYSLTITYFEAHKQSGDVLMMFKIKQSASN
uniref:Uncharacterized protein n=1 Tax=Methylophaga nitratireducenticrescens TaxID=754476 RepID=I1XM06_METNJ